MAGDVVYIDVEDGSKRVMNNTKLYAKLLTKFKDDATLKEIHSTLEAGDMAAAQIATHTFKGLTANLSLTELYKQCVELEDQIKSGSFKSEQLSLVDETYARTITEIDKVVEKYA